LGFRQFVSKEKPNEEKNRVFDKWELGFIRARSNAAKKVAEGLSEFETYICNNCEFIPNFGERRRQGKTISTAFVESTINQVVSRRFVRKQQMQWTLRGAHLLLQTRTKVLNEDLDDLFRPLVSEIQAATTKAGARTQGDLTPDFLALSLNETEDQDSRQNCAEIPRRQGCDSRREEVGAVASCRGVPAVTPSSEVFLSFCGQTVFRTTA
jgi:hypothetical protein